MLWPWIGLALLTCVGGLRHWTRLRSVRRAARPPRVDDAAIRRILSEGTLPGDADEPLDLEAAARAEEEFWSERWDEPEEYSR